MNRDSLRKILSIGEPAPVPETDPRVAGVLALADMMGDPPPMREAPQREVMARLGDNWSALILKVLATGTYRHATLKRIISALSAEKNISQRMLTLRLRALERDGFVTRIEHNTMPPRVDYLLTPLGHELVKELDRLIVWIESHMDQIGAARRRFSD